MAGTGIDHERVIRDQIQRRSQEGVDAEERATKERIRQLRDELEGRGVWRSSIAGGALIGIARDEGLRLVARRLEITKEVLHEAGKELDLERIALIETDIQDLVDNWASRRVPYLAKWVVSLGGWMSAQAAERAAADVRLKAKQKLAVMRGEVRLAAIRNESRSRGGAPAGRKRSREHLRAIPWDKAGAVVLTALGYWQRATEVLVWLLFFLAFVLVLWGQLKVARKQDKRLMNLQGGIISFIALILLLVLGFVGQAPRTSTAGSDLAEIRRAVKTTAADVREMKSREAQSRQAQAPSVHAPAKETVNQPGAAAVEPKPPEAKPSAPARGAGEGSALKPAATPRRVSSPGLQSSVELEAVAPKQKAGVTEPGDPGIVQHNVNGPNVVNTGGGSVTVNDPNAWNEQYLPNGKIRRSRGGVIVLKDGESSAVPKIKALYEAEDWKSLISFCEGEIEAAPRWWGPYLYAGVGYAKLGDRKRATERLEYLRAATQDDPDWEKEHQNAVELLGLLRDGAEPSAPGASGGEGRENQAPPN